MQTKGPVLAGPFCLARTGQVELPDASDAARAGMALPTGGATVIRHTLPVVSGDHSRFELLCVAPEEPWHRALYWLPALGISARNYLPLAEALAARVPAGMDDARALFLRRVAPVVESRF